MRSPKPAHLASGVDPALGELLSVHPYGFLGLGAVGLIIAGVIALVGWGLVEVWLQPDDPERRSFLGLLTVVAIALIAVLASVVRTAFHNSTTRVLLYAKGLVSTGPEETFAFPWDELESITERRRTGRAKSIPLGTDYYFTLCRRDGFEFTLSPSLRRFRNLAAVIRTEQLQRFLQPLIAALEQGKTISFGPLALGRCGIYHESNVLEWPAVKYVKLVGDMLRIEKKGAWITWVSVPIDQVPNDRLFLAIVDHCLGKANP